jgi:hypothetical protein
VGEVAGDTVEPYQYVSPTDFLADVPNTYTFREVGPTLRIDWSFPRATSESRRSRSNTKPMGIAGSYDNVETPYQQISWIGVDDEITETAPVNNAILRFVLPRPVDPGRTFIQGPGSERPEDHTESGQTWTWTASNLGRGDTLEAGLQFEPLVPATAPAWQEASDRQEQSRPSGRRRVDGSTAFPGIGTPDRYWRRLGGARNLWTRGRDPEVGQLPSFIPDPPDNLPPASLARCSTNKLINATSWRRSSNLDREVCSASTERRP